jgi:hypothetical protein
MADLGSLLIQGAAEMKSAKVDGFDPAWLERLATRMERASVLPETSREQEVRAIAHSLVDSGPMDESVCPSFSQVVGYFQRQDKRSR